VKLKLVVSMVAAIAALFPCAGWLLLRSQAATVRVAVKQANDNAHLSKALQQTQRDLDDTKDVLISVAGRSGRMSGAVIDEAIARHPAVASILPRLYICYIAKSNLAKIDSAVEQLQERDYLIPPYRHVGHGIARNELRYFDKNDEADANEIAGIFVLNGLPVEVRFLRPSGKIRPRHFELYIK
jgi:hypothetical protein